jgi:hypothetical protein
MVKLRKNYKTQKLCLINQHTMLKHFVYFLNGGAKTENNGKKWGIWYQSRGVNNGCLSTVQHPLYVADI